MSSTSVSFLHEPAKLTVLEQYTPHMDPAGQQALLALVAAGDEQAFGRLLRTYSDTIYSQAMAYTKSVEQSEELVQDVFMKLWRNRVKLLEVASFENWLFILARNLIFDSFKKNVALVHSPVSDGLAAAGDAPDLRAEYRESYQLLLKGIEQLPEKRKAVFKMSRLQGMSHKQIAETLGIHEITVAQYIVKSVSFLKDWLKAHTGDTILVIILLRGWY